MLFISVINDDIPQFFGHIIILVFEVFKTPFIMLIIYINSVSLCVCPYLMNERMNKRMTFLDDGGEGGSYSSKTDSREKRNQGKSDFLRQKIW
jgi:hypothetical protein